MRQWRNLSSPLCLIVVSPGSNPRIGERKKGDLAELLVDFGVEVSDDFLKRLDQRLFLIGEVEFPPFQQPLERQLRILRDCAVESTHVFAENPVESSPGVAGLLLCAPLVAIAKVICDRVDALNPLGDLLAA